MSITIRSASSGSVRPSLRAGSRVPLLRAGSGGPLLRAVASGLAGAAALTLAHEVARKLFVRSPRLDLAGERLVERGLKSLGLAAPSGSALYGVALAGDLVTYTACYGLASLGGPARKWVRGLWLGLGAGVDAMVAAPMLGLVRPPRRPTLSTRALTVGCYALGGVVAGLTADALDRRGERRELGEALRAIERGGDVVIVEDVSGTVEVPLGV